jgi:hypothetical protein
LLLEPRDLDILDTLESEGRYVELEHFEKALRDSDELKDIKVEVTKFDEILVFLNSLQHNGPIIIDFKRSLIILEDTGVTDVCN